MLDPGDPATDASIIAEHNALMKAGVRPPNPLSPAGRRYADAAERDAARRGGYRGDRLLKAQLDRGKSGSSSELHQRTAAEALARGDRGWHAVDALLRSPGLMGGQAPTDQKRPEFDPRNPGDPTYFEAEAADQVQRAALARGMQKAGGDLTLASMKLWEHARQKPLVAEAMRKAERKAAKKGRKVKPKDFHRALRKLEAKEGQVQKGAVGGLVPNVVDLRVPGVTR
jgi:hypothetical protein